MQGHLPLVFHGQLQLPAQHDPHDKDRQDNGDGGHQGYHEGPGATYLLCRDQVDYYYNLVIYKTYNQLRWGRTSRRKHLLLTKCFLCCCQRCLNHSECKTYITAIKCPECDGNMIQVTEMYSSEFDTDWLCESCKYKIPHKKVI